MIKVQLNNLQFHSFHGVYEEERKTGGDYMVDVELSFNETGLINKLDQTADYVAMFEIIKNRMSIPTQMLETIAMEIGDKLKTIFHQTNHIKVSIVKVHPPIPGMKGSASVTWEWNK